MNNIFKALTVSASLATIVSCAEIKPTVIEKTSAQNSIENCVNADNKGFCISIISPTNNSTYNVGDTLRVEWVSKGINKVYLGSSFFKGNLNWIKTNIPTSQNSTMNSYDFKVPPYAAGKDMTIVGYGFKEGVGRTDTTSGIVHINK